MPLTDEEIKSGYSKNKNPGDVPDESWGRINGFIDGAKFGSKLERTKTLNEILDLVNSHDMISTTFMRMRLGLLIDEANNPTF